MHMPGNLTFDQLSAAVAAAEIDTVIAAQVDMQGRLMGKRFHAQFFLDGAWRETHGCNYLLATDMEMGTVEGFASTSWSAGYGDYVLRPDMTTLRRIPWLAGTALVLCDTLDHHARHLIAHAPRSVLRGQIDRLAAAGWTATTATELECFVFKGSYEDAHASGHRDLAPVSAYNEDYHIFQTTKEEKLMRAIRNGLYGAGIAIEGTKGEADAGQEEINFHHGPALDTADDHSIIKNGAKEIAWAHGQSLTFMAKYADGKAGNSAHVHLSLMDAAGPAFFDPDAPHGMSQLMRHFLAGLIHHAPEITCFLAPYVNSYKRFVAGTFAPTKVVWSRDNRTAGFRVCGEGSEGVRVECRISGGDMNPYMAQAALIAAGLSGVENAMALPPEHRGDAYGDAKAPELPGTLRDAADALDASAMLRAAFGDAVIDHYVHAARHEVAAADRSVTDWDLRRGFERA
jgi:glutamine synthetase